MKTADRVSALMLLSISAYFLYESKDFSPFGALFPQVIVYILGILALALLILSFFKKSGSKLFEETKAVYLPVVTAFILVIGWVALLQYIGFFVTSIVFFSLITIFLDKKVTKTPILIKRLLMTCGFVTGFYLFFAKVMQVPFPDGIFF